MRSVVMGLALVLGLGFEAVAQQPPDIVVSATDVVELSLEDALRSAVQRSDEARLARSLVEVADAQVSSVRSVALPQINANLGYTRTFRSPFSAGTSMELPDSMKFSPDPSLPIMDRVRYLEDNAGLAGMGGLGSLFGNLPFGQENTYVAGISATQLIYSGGRTGAAMSIARNYREVTQHQLTEELAEIEFQVKSAYYRALFAEKLADAANEALAQAERFVDQERLRLEAGRASELDLLRAEVARENLQPQLVEAGNAADLARLNLLRLVGLPLTQPVNLSTSLEVPEAAATAAVDPLEVRERPALAALARQIDIKEDQVRVAKGAFLPSVSLQMNYGRQIFPAGALNFDGEWRTDWSAGVGVQIPIFNGLKNKAELEQARVELEQAKLQLTQTRKLIEMEFEQARGEQERARLAIGARSRTVEQAQRVHDLTEQRYERGLATQLEVSEARLALLQARTNEAQALMDYHTAEARLIRALGKSGARAAAGR